MSMPATSTRSAATSPALRSMGLLSAGALTIMAAATLSPALPAIEAHFADTPHADLLTRLVITLPALAIALCAPLAGMLADRWGRRPLLLVSVLLYGCAGLSGLVLDTLYAILGGRVALGVAVAGIMTAVTALAGDYFSGPARDRFMGHQAAFTGFGGLLFLTVGGVLAEWHWRAPFAIYAVAFVVLPAVLAWLAEPQRPASAVTTTAAAQAQGRVRGPLILLFTAAVMNSAVFYVVPTQLPFHLLQLGVDAPSRTGLAVGTMTFLSAIASLLYSRLRGVLSLTGIFTTGFGLMGVGFGLLSLATAYLPMCAALVFVGFGLGLVMPNLMSAALLLAPPALRGRVAGGLTTAIFLGHFLSPLISQPLIAHAGFTVLFQSLTGVLAVMAGAAFLLTIAARPGSRAANRPIG